MTRDTSVSASIEGISLLSPVVLSNRKRRKKQQQFNGIYRYIEDEPKYPLKQTHRRYKWNQFILFNRHLSQTFLIILTDIQQIIRIARNMRRIQSTINELKKKKRTIDKFLINDIILTVYWQKTMRALQLVVIKRR